MKAEMRKSPVATKSPAGQVVKDILPAARKLQSSEDEIYAGSLKLEGAQAQSHPDHAETLRNRCVLMFRRVERNGVSTTAMA